MLKASLATKTVLTDVFLMKTEEKLHEEKLQREDSSRIMEKLHDVKVQCEEETS